MRVILVCIIVAVVGSAFGVDSDVKQVREHFKSDSFTVEWGTARIFEPGAELEIGDGSGQGFTLNWLRFRPDDKRVEVLSIRLDGGRHPYKSKWPPDRAPVTVTRARNEARRLHRVAARPWPSWMRPNSARSRRTP